MSVQSSADRGGYVLVKSFRGAGLGDALRAVILALLYAEKNDRKVLVDWHDGTFGPEGDNVFQLLFRLEGQHAQAEFSAVQNSTSVLPPRWDGSLQRTMLSLWIEDRMRGWDRQEARDIYSFDQKQPHDAQVCVMWDFDALASYSLSDIQAGVRKCLRLQPEIELRRTAFTAEHFGSAMLGVHIRAANEQVVTKSSPSKSAILAAVRRKLNTGLYDGVFLSTDHLPTQHWFLKVFPGTVVRQKPFSDDESPLHLTDFGQPRLEQTRDALMDMVLLSSCHAIIHPGNSSFSLCAIYLSDLPATPGFKKVVTPLISTPGGLRT